MWNMIWTKCVGVNVTKAHMQLSLSYPQRCVRGNQVASFVNTRKVVLQYSASELAAKNIAV